MTAALAALLVPLILAPAARAEPDAAAYALPASLIVQEPATTQPAFAPRSVVVQLNNGTRVSGTLLAETDTRYELLTPELGRLTIDKIHVRALLDPAAPLGPAPPTVVAEPPPPPGIFGTEILAGWTKSVTLGFTGKNGNTDALDVYANLSGDYEDERARWRARASYLYGIAEGDNNKNEGFANVRRDWLRDENKLFYWAEGRADYNEFRDFKARLGGFAGIGYEFRDTPKVKLLGRLGAGGSYEFGVVDDFTPEALASVEGQWNVTERQTINLVNTIFPDLDELGEFRNFTELSWAVKVDAGRGLSLKLGVQNEYDSFTSDDSRHNDLTYFGALTLDF